MTDIVNKETRSRMMSGIKGENTKPEQLIRDELSKKGFRFILNDRTLPGKPDIVLREYHAVIFVQGCFWHGHNCHLFKWPSTRPEFWKSKIIRNQEVDMQSHKQLKADGWYILDVWECVSKGKSRKPIDKVMLSIEHWILFEKRNKTIRGK